MSTDSSCCFPTSMGLLRAPQDLTRTPREHVNIISVRQQLRRARGIGAIARASQPARTKRTSQRDSHNPPTSACRNERGAVGHRIPAFHRSGHSCSHVHAKSDPRPTKRQHPSPKLLAFETCRALEVHVLAIFFSSQIRSGRVCGVHGLLQASCVWDAVFRAPSNMCRDVQPGKTCQMNSTFSPVMLSQWENVFSSLILRNCVSHFPKASDIAESPTQREIERVRLQQYDSTAGITDYLFLLL